MPRGGKREGAGRNATLDYNQSLTIALMVEKSRTVILNEMMKHAIAKHLPSQDGIRKISHYKALGAETFDGDQTKRQKAYEISHLDLNKLEGFSEEIIDAADNLKLRRKYLEDNPQKQRLRIPRLYGKNKDIYLEVSDKATVKFGKRISPRMVETCWKNYCFDFKRSL